jgi:tetratricopeptide (TPR) repeat protein
MRAFVFSDRSLERQAGRFVWLALDTEKPENAPLETKFPVEALPTLFVVDPASEKVVLRYVGAVTVPQLQTLLEEGRRAAAADKPAGAESATADEALARANLLYAQRDHAGAAKAFEEALARAPEGWPSYGRAVESMLLALEHAGQRERAATLARDSLPRVRQTASAANVLAYGLDNALALPETIAARAELLRGLETAGREVAADATVPVSADDRSGLYEYLVEARKAAKDVPGAKETARAWAAFLEGEAGRAATPDGRAVFDSHRLAVYLELGQPERAIPMLEASERELPADYNPPARLAVALNAMKRWDDALAASDRALRKAYGPRRLRILQARAESFLGRGDKESARRVLEDALSIAEALPGPGRAEGAVKAIKAKIDSLK